MMRNWLFFILHSSFFIFLLASCEHRELIDPNTGHYLRIYLAGTVFSMVATGLNGYINAQGFPRIGMISVMIGALVNLALDPLFIFTLGLGLGIAEKSAFV